MNNEATGKVVQVQSSVVDVQFPAGEIADLYEGLIVSMPGKDDLVLEVEKQLTGEVVRCVAMDTTDWLQRDTPVLRTYSPITVPVGPETLGRVFNVLGRPVDNKGDIQSNLRYPIHRAAPTFDQQSTRVEVFETGLKVIDLIAPFTKGGKRGSSEEQALARQ